jgi:hypothetical protein
LRDTPIALVLVLAGCSQPLTPIHKQEIVKITVEASLKNRDKRVIELTQPSDIKFIVDHLTDLPSRLYDHSSPEIELYFTTQSGSSHRLRVSRIEIGPGAPASAWNRHWFPKDSALFDFLVARAYGSPSP